LHVRIPLSFVRIAVFGRSCQNVHKNNWAVSQSVTGRAEAVVPDAGSAHADRPGCGRWAVALNVRWVFGSGSLDVAWPDRPP
jgi:hypothetical protein